MASVEQRRRTREPIDDPRSWKSTSLVLACQSDGAVVKVTRTQKGKVDVETQIMSFKTE